MQPIPNKSLNISILPENDSFFAAAELIAKKLQAKLIKEEINDDIANTIIIFISQQGISIRKSGNFNQNPVFIDFCSKTMEYRRKNSGLKKEALAKAVGLKNNKNITIIDATAGLGRDSFILAGLGANIIMLERNPVIHLLLQDAISRASKNPNLAPITTRMQLIAADAIDFLDKISNKPDVIYLDPMFPSTGKTANSKKEMQLFQTIAGADLDIDILLTKALKTAKNRVVIKRPRKSPYINNLPPHHNISGSSCRFDVYMVGKSG